MTELTALAESRIRLYGCLSHGMSASDELCLDAMEIPGGGWTARDGDREDRLYGASAFEYIVDNIGFLLGRIDRALQRYIADGGDNPDVFGDVEAAVAFIRRQLAKSEKLQAEYNQREEEAC
jgi:hypothetical protein